MHRVLLPEFAGLDGRNSRDFSELFFTTPASSRADNSMDASDEGASVFSKHRIRKIGVVTPRNQRTSESGNPSKTTSESGYCNSSPSDAERSRQSLSSANQLLISEVDLLQATIRNKEMLLANTQQELHELRLKIEQQGAENRSLKDQIIDMKEAAAVVAEHHAIETQSYLAKVLDAEEMTLQAASAIELAAKAHEAANAAQRAASNARFENSAYKRDKDRLIHLLSLFEPAKALASQLQRIPSHYFPMPGLGSSAISSITRIQLTSSSFVKPAILKTLTAECTLWMSSKIANAVLGWGLENKIDESILMPLLMELNNLWSESTKKIKEANSVSRLKNKISPRDQQTMETERKGKMETKSKDKQKKLYSSSPASQIFSHDSARSSASWGQLLETGLNRLRSHSQNRRGLEDQHRIISPESIRSLHQSEERSRETHDIIPLDLLESLKKEMQFAGGDHSAEKHSQSLPQSATPKVSTPLERGTIELRNTTLRISLLHE